MLQNPNHPLPRLLDGHRVRRHRLALRHERCKVREFGGCVRELLYQGLPPVGE